MNMVSNQTGKITGAELLSEEVLIAEKKIIRIGHYQNRRGPYLRISETTDNGYDFVIIPFSAAAELHSRLGKILDIAKRSPITAPTELGLPEDL